MINFFYFTLIMSYVRGIVKLYLGDHNIHYIYSVTKITNTENKRLCSLKY